MADDEVMTVPEAAEALGVSRIAVLQAIYHQALPATKFGPVYMLKRADVEAYRARRPWTVKPGWPEGSPRRAAGAVDQPS